jgi:hypothetical protein
LHIYTPHTTVTQKRPHNPFASDSPLKNAHPEPLHV